MTKNQKGKKLFGNSKRLSYWFIKLKTAKAVIKATKNLTMDSIFFILSTQIKLGIVILELTF